MSSPLSGSDSSLSCSYPFNGLHPMSSALHNLGHLQHSSMSMNDYNSPTMSANTAFCGAFGMDSPSQYVSNSSSHSHDSSAFSHASPPLASGQGRNNNNMTFNSKTSFGATFNNPNMSSYAMNLALLQAAAAAQAKNRFSSPVTSNSNCSSMRNSFGRPDEFHALHKTALLEAENEALKLKLQRDSAEKMNLVHMLFSQMHQGGQMHGRSSGSSVAGGGSPSISDEDKQRKEKPTQSRYWAEDEHQRFLEAVKVYGAHDHKAIAAKVATRSSSQVRSHSQKFFKKLEMHQGAGLPSMNRKKKDNNKNIPSQRQNQRGEVKVEG